MKLFYIDCGANTGRTVLHAIRSGRYHKFAAIEANPELHPVLCNLQARESHADLEVISAAVWTTDERGPFFTTRTWGENYKGGSTLLHGKSSNRVDYDHPVDVRLLNFARWLELEMQRLGPSWRAAIKMDIEGAEYEVLEALIDHGLLSLIVELSVEFHVGKLTTIAQARHDRLIQRLNQWGGLATLIEDKYSWRVAPASIAAPTA